MKPLPTLAAAFGAALLAVVPAAGQIRRSQVFTLPEPPPREALDRLNLVEGWHAYVPMEGRRDGFAGVQADGNQLLVQTRSGLVAALDAGSGRILWRTRVGRPYQPTQPLAYNRRSVYYLNGTFLFALDRATGALLWEFSVPGGGVTAPPVADEFQIYLASGEGRLSAYVLPLPLARQRPLLGDRSAASEAAAAGEPDEAARVRTAESGSRGSIGGGSLGAFSRPAPLAIGPQPFLRWDAITGSRVEVAPVSRLDRVAVIDPEGVLVGYEKFPENNEGSVESYRVRLAAGTVSVPASTYEGTAYVGSRDSNLYAVDLRSGQEVWRYTTGSPVTRRPATTFQDVYVSSEQGGLARVDRASGGAAWRMPSAAGAWGEGNQEAQRFVAANPKFVYAVDASGRLLVLDRRTGNTLSRFDGTRDFVYPIANESDDRVLLAAHNGLLVSLHDRDYATPYRHRSGGPLATADPKLASITEKLLTPVTDKSGGDAVTLDALLKAFEKDYGLQVVLDEEALKAAGMGNLSKRLVSVPRVTAVPLGEVLRRVLAQVNATYTLAEGKVVVTPLPKR